MKKFNTPLSPLYRLRSFKEKEIHDSASKQNKIIDNLKRNISQLQNAQANIANGAESEFDIDAYVMASRYNTKLQINIIDRRAQIDKEQQTLHEILKRFQNAYVERKALEIVIDKQRKIFLKTEKDKENEMLDEIGAYLSQR